MDLWVALDPGAGLELSLDPQERSSAYYLLGFTQHSLQEAVDGVKVNSKRHFYSPRCEPEPKPGEGQAAWYASRASQVYSVHLPLSVNLEAARTGGQKEGRLGVRRDSLSWTCQQNRMPSAHISGFCLTYPGIHTFPGIRVFFRQYSTRTCHVPETAWCQNWRGQ